MGLFLLWAFWGAIVDWRYKRRGGVRPTTKDRVLFLICFGVCLGGVLLLGYRGASADALGSLSGFLTIVLLSAWELGRWRIRRKHPVK
jgi:drug/metabolite transporter (DMT)-like permease